MEMEQKMKRILKVIFFVIAITALLTFTAYGSDVTGGEYLISEDGGEYVLSVYDEGAFLPIMRALKISAVFE